MSPVKILLFPVAMLLGACAYAPQSTELSWTDGQLQSAPPSDAPDYIPQERLGRMEIAEFLERQSDLARQRDDVQQAAADLVPEPAGDTEAYAEDARERAQPPGSR